MSRNDIVERHPSFGVVSLSKPQGGGMRLVGTMLSRSPSWMELRFFEGERRINRDLHTEYFTHSDRRPLLEVRLSLTQWAELICSPYGVEIPCTMAVIDGKRIDAVPEDTTTPLEEIAEAAQKQSFDRAKDGTAQYMREITSLRTAIAATGLSKKKVDELNRQLDKLANMATVPEARAKWAAERLAEETEKLVSHAKLEVVTYAHEVAKRVGIDPQLIAPDIADVRQLPQGTDD